MKKFTPNKYDRLTYSVSLDFISLRNKNLLNTDYMSDTMEDYR